MTTAGFELDHCTRPVTSAVLPSLIVAVAVNCWFSPIALVTGLGLMVIPVAKVLKFGSHRGPNHTRPDRW